MSIFLKDKGFWNKIVKISAAMIGTLLLFRMTFSAIKTFLFGSQKKLLEVIPDKKNVTFAKQAKKEIVQLNDFNCKEFSDTKDGLFKFVINCDKEKSIYATKDTNNMSHDNLSTRKDKKVKGAGVLKYDSNRIIFLHNYSGHYMQSYQCF